MVKHYIKSIYVDLSGSFIAPGFAPKRQVVNLKTVKTGCSRYSCEVFAKNRFVTFQSNHGSDWYPDEFF